MKKTIQQLETEKQNWQQREKELLVVISAMTVIYYQVKTKPAKRKVNNKSI